MFVYYSTYNIHVLINVTCYLKISPAPWVSIKSFPYFAYHSRWKRVWVCAARYGLPSSSSPHTLLNNAKLEPSTMPPRFPRCVCIANPNPKPNPNPTLTISSLGGLMPIASTHMIMFNFNRQYFLFCYSILNVYTVPFIMCVLRENKMCVSARSLLSFYAKAMPNSSVLSLPGCGWSNRASS